MIKQADMNYVTFDDLDACNLAKNDPKYFESLAGRIGVLNLYSLSLCEINNNEFIEFSPEIEMLKEKQEKI